MKHIALISALFICLAAAAQKKGATMRDLQGLPGNWTGQFTFLDDKATDSKKGTTTEDTKLEIAGKGDSMILSFSYSNPHDGIKANKTSLRIYNEGKNLSYGGYELDIVAVRRLGDRLTIIAELDQTGINRGTVVRETFIIGLGILNITKEMGDEGSEKFSRINWMELKKKGA